jgi:hypothetical protein
MMLVEGLASALRGSVVRQCAPALIRERKVGSCVFNVSASGNDFVILFCSVRPQELSYKRFRARVGGSNGSGRVHHSTLRSGTEGSASSLGFSFKTRGQALPCPTDQISEQDVHQDRGHSSCNDTIQKVRDTGLSAPLS